MSDRPTPHDQQWWELLDAVVEETATDAQWQEIDTLLRGNPQFRRLYVAHLQTMGQLDWQRRNHTASGPETPTVPRSTPRRIARFFTQRTPLSLTVAALVMLLLITTMAFMAAPFYRAVVHEDVLPEISEQRFVAQLTGLHEVVWAEGERATRGGAFLRPGHRLTFSQGLVEVAYRGGDVRVILEGPCDYRIATSASGRLENGRLAAKVSPAGVGFVVETPLATVTDLGTEFGVELRPDEATQVVVYTGQIQIDASATRGAAPRRLAAGEVATISPGGALLVTAGDTAPKIARNMPPRAASAGQSASSLAASLQGRALPDGLALASADAARGPSFTNDGIAFASGGDTARNYMRTEDGGYHRRDFTAYVTARMDLRQGGNQFYFGMGSGRVGQYGLPDVDAAVGVYGTLNDPDQSQAVFEMQPNLTKSDATEFPTSAPAGTSDTAVKLIYEARNHTITWLLDFDYTGDSSYAAFSADQSSGAHAIGEAVVAGWQRGSPSRIVFGGDDGVTVKNFRLQVAERDGTKNERK